MNNPNPFIPQGSLLEQKTKSRARLRAAFFCVLAINIVPITLALMMQGCRKPVEPGTEMNATTPPFETNPVPTLDTNVPGTNVTGVLTPESTPPPVAPAAAPQEYAVARGDTFTTIAKKFGLTLKAIQEANPGVEPTKLQIGQKLHIPASASAAAPAGATPPGAIEMGPTGEQTYTVKSGDTLTKIAADFGTTVKAIRSENKLTTDKITVGQKLKIPGKNPSPAPATNTTA